MQFSDLMQWRQAEQIAWIAQEILGSFGRDYTSQDITQWIARFNSDLFDDSQEQLEIVDLVDQFLTDYIDELEAD